MRFSWKRRRQFNRWLRDGVSANMIRSDVDSWSAGERARFRLFADKILLVAEITRAEDLQGPNEY